MSRVRRGPTDLAVSVTKFLTDYLVGERGCSQRTVSGYASTIGAYLAHVEGSTGTSLEDIGLESLNAEHVRSYLDSVEASGCCAATRNLRLAALKSLARYAMRENPQFLLEGERILAIRSKRVPKGEPDYLEAESMRALLAAPDRTTTIGRREAALMSTLYETGARVSELIGLELRDLRLSEPRSATLRGKGGKTRVVPTSEATAELILAHLADRGIDPRDQPFLATRAFCPPGRSEYSRPGIAKMISRNLSKASESHPELPFPDSTHPHAFRASRAIHLIDSGIDIVSVRDFLGHASVTTTEIYLRATTEQKLRAIERACPSLTPPTHPEMREDRDLRAFLRDKCKG